VGLLVKMHVGEYFMELTFKSLVELIFRVQVNWIYSIVLVVQLLSQDLQLLSRVEHSTVVLKR
jgi:hypothetical protein